MVREVLGCSCRGQVNILTTLGREDLQMSSLTLRVLHCLEIRNLSKIDEICFTMP